MAETPESRLLASLRPVTQRQEIASTADSRLLASLKTRAPAAPSATAVSADPWAPDALATAIAFPANFAMQQLGNRVDALEASAAEPFVNAVVQDEHTNPLRFLGNLAKAVATGQPPSGLPQGAASYTLARRAGLGEIPAQIAATAGGFLAAGPLNDVALGTMGALRGGAAALRAAPGIQAAAEATAPLGRKFSRSYELPVSEKHAMEQALYEGRGVENLTNFDFRTLAAERLNASKAGAMARGTSVAEAQNMARTATENLGRMPQDQALAGLLPEEQAAVIKTRDLLGRIPISRADISMTAYKLEGGPRAVGYEPRIVRPEAAALLAQEEGLARGTQPYRSRVNELRTGPLTSRETSPELTTEQVAAQAAQRLGTDPAGFFEPSSEALAKYGASVGRKMRGATILNAAVKLSRPAALAPKGWLDPSRLNLAGGMSDAWKAQWRSARISPTLYRYLEDWNAPAATPGKIGAAWQSMIRWWKPLVTTAVPEFAERFAATHAMKLVADGETSPMAFALGGGKMDPASAVSFKGAPDLRTVADFERSAVKAGASGAPQTEFQPLIAPLAKLNEGIYQATKRTYYASRLLKGDTEFQAAKLTRRALADYSPANFTNTVNAARKNGVPFLAFTYQLIPTFARTVAERPGSLGAMAQVARNQNARLGLTDADLRRLGPGAEEGGAVALWRGSGADSNQVTILNPSFNPLRHVNQVLGTRGRGWRGPLDIATSMAAPPIGAIEQAYTLRNALQGKTVDPTSFQKVPPGVAILPRPVRDAFQIVSAHGEYFAPPDVAQFAWQSPGFVNAMVNAAQAVGGSAVAKRGLGRFSGLSPIRPVDLRESDRYLAYDRLAKQRAMFSRQRNLNALNARALEDSLRAAGGR